MTRHGIELGTLGGSAGMRPTIEAHVLGKRLGTKELQAQTGEEAHRVSVPIQVTGGKALVGAIKEGEVALLL